MSERFYRKGQLSPGEIILREMQSVSPVKTIALLEQRTTAMAAEIRGDVIYVLLSISMGIQDGISVEDAGVRVAISTEKCSLDFRVAPQMSLGTWQWSLGDIGKPGNITKSGIVQDGRVEISGLTPAIYAMKVEPRKTLAHFMHAKS